MNRRNNPMYKPKTFIDGNKWCALYGDNLQVGSVGFGDTEEEAVEDYYSKWEREYEN